MAIFGKVGSGGSMTHPTLLIEDEANALVFSAASIWEVAIKAGLGRADFKADPGLLRRGLVDNGYAEVAITGAQDLVAAAGLPPLHGDPFDRMLGGAGAGRGAAPADGRSGAHGVSGGGAAGVSRRRAVRCDP